MNDRAIQAFDFRRCAIALRDEQLPALVADQSELATLRRQAEALESAGRALEETAALMKRQAELFEGTIARLREPAEIAKTVAGLERRDRVDAEPPDG